MLSHELYDEYGDEYHKFLKEAFAMSDYTISSVDMDNNSCVATISYRQLKYFEAVEKEYNGYVRLAMEEWLDNPEEIPTDEEELKTHVLALLYLSMRDALESVEYGKKVSAEVDLDSDGEDGLVAFFFDGFFDTYKLEPYAEKRKKDLKYADITTRIIGIYGMTVTLILVSGGTTPRMERASMCGQAGRFMQAAGKMGNEMDMA